MKNKTLSIVLCVLIVLVIILSCGFIGFLFVQSQMTPEYNIYIGLNDKDTGEGTYTYEEASAIVDSVCSKYFNGYTLYPASGRWTDPSGNLIHENTIVCHLLGSDVAVDEEKVRNATDELLIALNQHSILVEERMSWAGEVTGY
ncbi:MAG TPA: DUF3574 domain-containing protein [Methanocorpusculum sp.]|nr:DUF3574 domain-containing protein [Candidatus Methanocorpusculum equi]MCQ2357876.1 DUF3574 domain-containing protein [Methanocorpusculum sp.]HJJ33725.1 DUF3574 domain-containing protein [Methanocorpusculum sp.]HJJ45394.1 DUF3574 domain-containing protein [Methanocorpusculum sp.]